MYKVEERVSQVVRHVGIRLLVLVSEEEATVVLAFFLFSHF